MKLVSLAPAVLLIAQHKAISISELVDLYQRMGFGGARSCRKLIHRLERLELIAIAPGVRGDRREKAVAPTPRAMQMLAELNGLLDRLVGRLPPPPPQPSPRGSRGGESGTLIAR
jgi:hypothetical protein